MKLDIYRGTQSSVIASTSAFEVNRTLMEVRKITCNMKSVIPIEWTPYNGGTYDFVMYNSEKYILYAKPTSEERNEVGQITYKLTFSGQEILLQNAPFLDVVTGTGSSIDEYRYTNGSIVNFFGDIRQFVLRLNANITYFNNHGGDLAGWTVELDLSSDYDYREFNVSSANSSLLDALKMINSAYSLKYYFDTKGANKKVIITDKVRSSIDYVFQQGEGNGLYNLSATVSADKDVVTRLRPLGGSRNIPTDYKKDAKPIDNTRYCPNLMLPNDANGNIVYTIDSASGIQKYGIREKSVTQEFEGIYPSIRSVTLRDVYGTSSLPTTGNDGVKLTGLSASQRVDQIIGSSQVLNEQQNYFYVYLTDIGFYLDKTNEDGVYVYATTNEAVISMRTGLYTGVEFTIVKGKTKQLTGGTEDNPDADIAQTATDVEMYNAGARYRVKLMRTEDNGAKFPSANTLTPALSAGSEFVILNIFMPPVYVTMAENKLKQAAMEFLSIYDHSLYTIGLNVATGFTIEHPEIFPDQFLEGSRLKVKSNKIGVLDDAGGPIEINVQSVTVRYTEKSVFPTYDCTLAEIKKQTIFEQLSSEIRNVSASQTSLQSAGLSASAVSDILQRLQIIGNMFEWDKERTAIKAKFNLYGVGEITAYGYGTDVPWTTSLGNLTNVVNNADDVAGVDYILFKAKGASTWTLKDATDIGGGKGKIYYAGSGITLTDSNGDTANTINVRFGQGAGLVMEGSDSRVLTAISDISNIKKTTFWGQTMTNNKVEGALTNTGSLTPSATGVSDLGSATLKYRNVYASLVGNADTATKLKTPVDIWGQPFDGSAPIVGDMMGVSIINQTLYFSGNKIGINHPTPDCALHVSGTIKATGEVVAYATSDYDPSQEFPKATKTSYGWVQIGENINVVNGVISAAKQGLDETQLAAYLAANNYLNASNYTTYTVTKTGTGATGTWSISISGNAANATTATSAGKLATARTLWGQSFNGSANVSGAISNTGNITPTTTNVSTVGTTALVYKAMYATSFVGALLGNATTSSMWDTAITLSAGGDASGSTEIRGDANATLTLSVNKLHTARSLWGQSFDGSGNVSGNISLTGNITPSATGVSDIGSTALKYRNIYGNLVGNVSGNVSGTLTGNVTGNVSGSAGSLAATRTIWGQNFNGTQNVSGAMSGVSNINSIIYISGTNVGIRKSTPAVSLDITGDVQSSGTIKAGGEVVAYATSDYDPSQDIPKASKTSYGWVKIGDNINVVDGVISAAKQGMDETALAAYLSSKGYLNSTNYTNYTVTKTGGGATGTWGIGISGNAATATTSTSAGKLTTARNIALSGAVTGSANFDGSTNITIATSFAQNFDSKYVLKTGDTMSGNLTLKDSAATGARMLKFTGYTDYAHIKFSAATSDNSYLEIATGDNGNTPIYIRQYNTSGAVVRTLTLLGSSGIMQIPFSLEILNAHLSLSQGSSNTLRVKTAQGFVDVGPKNTDYCHFETDRERIYFNKSVYVQGELYAGQSYNQKVWHAGNDGAGSGLDADLLDGKQGNSYMSFQRVNIDANNYTSIGVWESNTSTNMPTTNPWHQIMSWGTGDSRFGFQMANQYTANGGLFIRHKISDTWYAWREVLDNYNYGGYLNNTYVNVSGDTMTGRLAFNLTNTADTGNAITLKLNNVIKGVFGHDDTRGIYMYNPSGSHYLGILNNGNPHYDNYSLYCESNAGSFYKWSRATRNSYQVWDLSNTTTYNVNTYYPVTITLATNEMTRHEIQVSLDSGTKPSWSTHAQGYSVRLVWEENGAGWGTIPVVRKIISAAYSFASQSPIGGMTQLTNSSICVLWLRGGGKYFYYSNGQRTKGGPYTTQQTASGQTFTTRTLDEAKQGWHEIAIGWIYSEYAVSGPLSVASGIQLKGGNNAGPAIYYYWNGRNKDVSTWTSRIWESTPGRLAITGKLAVGAASVNDSYALSATSFYSSGNLTVNGVSTFSGTVNTNAINASTITCSNWLRTTGDTGWFSEKYRGGIYMTDETWVRVYNSKAFFASDKIKSNTYFDRGSYGGSSWNNGQGAYNVEILNNSAQTPIIVAYRSGYTPSVTGGNRLFSFELLNTGSRIYWGFGGYKKFEFRNTGDFFTEGSIVSKGEVTAYTTSDMRLKKNIQPMSVEYSKSVLKSIRPVTYEWNGKAFELNPHQRYKGRETGLIAQELQPILPCAIKTVFGEYMSIDYTRLIPPIIAVVNEHEQEIERLKKRIKELESKFC